MNSEPASSDLDKPAASQRSEHGKPNTCGRVCAALDNVADKPVSKGRSEPVGNQSASRRSERSCPPCNPGLQRLVEGKQAWSEPLDEDASARGFLGWHQRGYLPHHDVPGATQLVTFRLHDAIPVSLRSEWEGLLHLEDKRESRKRIEAYLDRGLGQCWLRQPSIAALAENALRHFDGQRYRLEAWVVMPNHLHLVVEVWQMPLAGLAHSWKGFIAREANKVLRREGRFWEREYWETLIKDDTHCAKARRYVEANPVKAGLVREASEWTWSSARLRDEYGRLANPPKTADRSARSAGLQPALDER